MTSMPKDVPTETKSGTIAGHYSKEMLHYLLHRRSVPRSNLVMPGPSAGEIRQILEAASRVSDHGRMYPFWFTVFEGKEKAAFETVLAESLRKQENMALKGTEGTVSAADGAGAQSKKPGEDDSVSSIVHNLMAAPLVIAVISSVRDSNIAVWEQFMVAGAVCQNLVLAANASGYGVNWLTEWYAYDPDIRKALHLEEHENIAGFFSIGTAEDVPDDRDRPVVKELTTYWKQDNILLNKGQVYAQAKEKKGKGKAGFVLPPNLLK